MKELIFLTGNKGKFAELAEFLGHTKIALRMVETDLEEIQGTDARKIIRHKAKQALKHGIRVFLLEDTSLYIEGMGSLPGPLIKWFLEEIGNDGLYRLARLFGKGTAVAETIMAFAEKDGKIKYFSGRSRGRIVKPRGKLDFGWGPAFLPDGSSVTFGQMDRKEKQKYSMRIKAFRNLKKYLTRT